MNQPVEKSFIYYRCYDCAKKYFGERPKKCSQCGCKKIEEIVDASFTPFKILETHKG